MLGLPRLAVGSMLLMLVTGTLAAITRKNASPADTKSAASIQSPTGDLDAIDCASGFEPIAGRGCLVLAGPATPLIVYLHGLYERTAPSEELDRQSRLAKHAKSHGFTVLALRGREGACTAPDFKQFICWPSNERTQDAGASVVGEWAKPLQLAEERSGHGKRYLLGFSNGGFFAGVIAMNALLRVDGFAIAHAGTVEPFVSRGEKPPLLLLSADEDSAQEGMIHFDEVLTRDAWSHEIYAREGGHALSDADIEAALTFFERIANGERPPFLPPLSKHQPHPQTLNRPR